VRIRPARPDDAQAVARNHQAAWQDGYRGIIADDLLDGLDLAARIERWQRQIVTADEDRHVLVVTDEGGLWGHCAVGPASRPEDAGGEILSLYVSPDRWARGYGRALLIEGRQLLVDLGHRTLLLWVLEGNARAQALYASDGWTFTGERQPLVIGDTSFGVDELQMRWMG